MAHFENLALVLSDTAKAHMTEGLRFQKQGQLDQAVVCYRKAITHAPDFAMLHGNLGTVLQALGRHEDALDCFGKALSLEPGQPKIHCNHGSALHKLDRHEDAIESFQMAIRLNPEYDKAWSNLGIAQQELGLLENAQLSYQKSIGINPENAEAHHNLSLLHLLNGNLKIGFEESQWRWKIPDHPTPSRVYDAPQWRGEPLENCHIFIYPEQGYGDQIQFIRYVSLLKDRGARVSVEVPRALFRLFSNLKDIDALITPDKQPSAFDYHLPMLDLPRVFGTTLHTIPDQPYYLQAHPGLSRPWANKLEPHTAFRLGLVWAGNPDHKRDHKRSIDPQLYQALATISGIDLFSLQLGHGGDALSSISENVRDLAPDLGDFAETAAILRNLHMVITVDTAIAHLAGAMGLPVWTLLSYVPDWRWMLERRDTPWYPTMRLFRQKLDGDWQGVMNTVVRELREYVRSKS